MIKPSEIHRVEFTKAVRGYKEEEVEEFLEEIAADLEVLLRENESLRESLKVASAEIERYRGSENAIFTTLESAKALMTDISASAENRAEIVMKNAELDAERIRQDAKAEVERLTEDAVALSRRWALFSARFRNLLETELERFDSFAAELMPEEGLPAATEPVTGEIHSATMVLKNPSNTIKTRK
jgi:cell division initiation protein